MWVLAKTMRYFNLCLQINMEAIENLEAIESILRIIKIPYLFNLTPIGQLKQLYTCRIKFIVLFL